MHHYRTRPRSGSGGPSVESISGEPSSLERSSDTDYSRPTILRNASAEGSMALVVFLRCVNVGGHKTFRPSALAKDLAEFGVVNIGAAGTFVVRKAVSREKLLTQFRRRLPFETAVVICDGRDLIRLDSENPFAGAPSGSNIVRFVSVLSKPSRTPPPIPIHIPPDGEW